MKSDSGKHRERAGGGLAALGGALAAIGAALALAACGSGGPSTNGGEDASAGKPQQGGTLTIATALEPVSLDPAVGNTEPGSQHVQTLIFSRLLEVRPGSLDLVPALAESWKLSSDQRSAIIHLRTARFSDGMPVTSEDVKFSFERAMNEKIDPNFGESLTQMIQSIGTPDARTVVLHFAGPRPAVFYYLAFAPLGIVNKHAFEQMGAKRFGAEPLGAGAGPFQIVRWVKGQGVYLKRNPYYWRTGLPYLNGVNILHVANENTRLLDVRTGQIDAADEVPYSQLASLKNVPGVKLHLAPVPAVYGVAIRPTSSGALKSEAVRQALNYAMPKEAIRKVVFAGQGALGNSGLMPPLHYWDSNVKPYPYDLAKARRLLSEAGYAHGFTLTLGITSGDEVSHQTATILQSAWAKLGVNLQVEVLDEGTMQTRLSEASYEALLFPPTYWSSDIPSEDEFAINLANPGGEKAFGVKDPKINALVKRIEGTWNEEARHKLFAERQQEEMRYMFYAPIVVAEARTALRDNVEGFGYVAMSWFYLDQTWLKR